jgi:alpha/beta hydrolase family protein
MSARVGFHFVFFLVLMSSVAVAQERAKSAKPIKDAVSCNEFAPAAKQLMGQFVGVEQCYIISEEIVFNINEHKFRRVEVRLSGGVEGWASREKGSRAIYFTDGPDFVLAQSGLTGPRSRGVGRYEATTGHGMTIFYPEDARNWNGKLFITAHGAGSYGAVGALIPRDSNNKFDPLAGVNRYIGLMIDKGYAVAHTMRSSDRIRGDVSITLEDGTKLSNYNLSSHAGLITSWGQLARTLIVKRIGGRSTRNYFYGHSAGGFLGRQINYQPGANLDAEGKPFFDGFLVDDAGSGLWLPKLIVDNKDVLFTTDEERRRFAKQIDVTHMLYAGDTGDYVQNKRENARLLREKGLSGQHRLYEIRGVSHFDAGQISRPDLVNQALDLGGIFDALIDRLDEWVEKNNAPTPTKADAAELAGANAGSSEHAAVALPEVACPLGIYFAYPPQLDPGRRGGQETAFGAFDGTNLEPLDGRGVYVDMNGNGVRDKRESLTQAWQRLGLLKSGQQMTSAVYQNCVKNAAAKLVKQGLLPAKLGEYYLDKASRTRLLN